MATDPEYGPPPKTPITKSGLDVHDAWLLWFMRHRDRTTELYEKEIERQSSPPAVAGVHALKERVEELEALIHVQPVQSRRRITSEDVTSSRDVDEVYHNNSGRDKLCIISVKLYA